MAWKSEAVAPGHRRQVTMRGLVGAVVASAVAIAVARVCWTGLRDVGLGLLLVVGSIVALTRHHAVVAIRRDRRGGVELDRARVRRIIVRSAGRATALILGVDLSFVGVYLACTLIIDGATIPQRSHGPHPLAAMFLLDPVRDRFSTAGFVAAVIAMVLARAFALESSWAVTFGHRLPTPREAAIDRPGLIVMAREVRSDG